MAIILICLIFLLKDSIASKETEPSSIQSSSYIYSVLKPISQDYNLETNEILAYLIECESGGNPKAHNKNDPNGGSFGLLQFQLSTFKNFCVDKYYLENDIWDPNIQIKCARSMIDENLAHHWTCFKGLTR